MANGFEINISEYEFKAKDKDDQTWILFQGIVSANKCIAEIENDGCDYGKKRYRTYGIKMASAIAAGITGSLGVIYIIWCMVKG
jgi:hypothetical protein